MIHSLKNLLLLTPSLYFNICDSNILNETEKEKVLQSYQDDPSKTFRHTDFIKADFNELKKEPDFVLLSHFSMRLIGKFQMSSNV